MNSTEGNTAYADLTAVESRRRLFEARDLALGGLLGALAFVLPIAFHALGPGVGPIFLPMYYPILALGLLASWEVTLLVGIIVPILSSVLTGMPPPPTAVLMVCELVALGVVASLARGLRVGVWPAAISAIVLSRLVGALLLLTLLPLFGITRGITEYLIAAVTVSLPGTIIMLTIVPAAVYAIERTSIIGHRCTKSTTHESE